MNNHLERLAYSIKTFAQSAELSESFVKREIYAGNLKTVKRGGRVLIPVDCAKAYLSAESVNNEARIQTESLATQV